MIIARTKFFTRCALLLLLNVAANGFAGSYATRVDRTAAYLAQTKSIGAVALFGACVLAYKQFENKLGQAYTLSDESLANLTDESKIEDLEEKNEVAQFAIKTNDKSAISYLECRARLERERLQREPHQSSYLSKVCTWGSRLWNAFTRP